jgi:tRNA dimethylallyltransferase
MKKNEKKIIVILGPTASGKTKLAVELAHKFNGEIVSADSRQVYRGMDVGTGKDLKEFSIFNFQFSNKLKNIEQKPKITKIPYHLIDIASPKAQFNLAEYQKLAFIAIDDILKRGKLPILAGGSGLYLQAVVDNYKLSDAKKGLALRKKLEKLTISRLVVEIKKLSPKMAAKINDSDRKNKRRLIRYLEILLFDKNFKSKTAKEKYQVLLMGPACSGPTLRKRIYERLINRLEKERMVDEVKRLHEQGLSWKKLESFGLEYKFVSQYLQKKLDYEEMVEKLNRAINQFARRQMSWFRRWEKQGAEINWVKSDKKIKMLIKQFLK